MASRPRLGGVEGFVRADEADPKQPGVVVRYALQRFQGSVRYPQVGIQVIRQHAGAYSPCLFCLSLSVTLS